MERSFASQVKFLTEKECALGIAIYPDVAFNGEGGYAQGAARDKRPLDRPRIDFAHQNTFARGLGGASWAG